jgi:hypothetical protein
MNAEDRPPIQGTISGASIHARAKSIEEMYIPMGGHRLQGKFSPETDEYPKS